MNRFAEGYRFFTDNAGAIDAVFAGAEYVAGVDEHVAQINHIAWEEYRSYIAEVEKEITALADKINSLTENGRPTLILKGNVAEFWHGGTFNINAAAQGVAERAKVLESHQAFSPDIQLGEQNYSLKFHGAAESTAKAQVFSGYNGQARLVPTEQMERIKEWYEKQIDRAKERLEEQLEPAKVQAIEKRLGEYQEALGNLTDRLRNHGGTESIPITIEELEQITREGKEGIFSPEEHGLVGENFVAEPEMMETQYEHILQQAWKAGMSAMVISMVLKTAPEILKAIHYLIQTGELDERQFEKIGFAALTGGAEGFVRGSVAAAITASCKAGLCGQALRSVSPSVVGAITVLAINTMKNSYRVARGEMTRRELTDRLIQETYLSACALIGGGIVQGILPQLPVLGFMLGSFLGSIAGSFTYDTGYRAALSFCVDTGFTMFGLVEQNYQLPENVMAEIGLDVFEYEKFVPLRMEHDKFEPPQFQYESFKPDVIDIVFLRRGVIGIRRIGYV